MDTLLNNVTPIDMPLRIIATANAFKKKDVFLSLFLTFKTKNIAININNKI
ncbi:hypothetical protein FACS189485_18050 [Spirochaetia bacterium]|nr:hypothetical protein FACS189485_18050 [Spirochaetia bacterium]